MAYREFLAIFVVGVCISMATQLEGISQGHDIVDSSSGFGTIVGDEDFLEMSGDFSPTSLCRRQELEASVKKHPDTFVAKCDKDGEFKTKQCHKDRCWCVTNYGLEIPETRHPTSISFNCLDVIEKSTINTNDATASRHPSVYLSNVKTTAVLPSFANPKSDEVIIDEVDYTKPHKNVIDQMVFENNAEISIGNPNNNGIEASMLERKATSSPSKIPIYNHPGLLAGIIGGTTLGLLCIVLSVMFLVYRMRKKDEGSYALDEPKASPSCGLRKPHDREFFA